MQSPTVSHDVFTMEKGLAYLRSLEQRGITRYDAKWAEYKGIISCNLVRFDGRLGRAKGVGIRTMEDDETHTTFEVILKPEGIAMSFHLDKTRPFENVKKVNSRYEPGATLYATAEK